MPITAPDWTPLNAIAASFLASTPLATEIAAVTPAGSYTASGLQRDLDEILAAAKSTLSAENGVLVIAVDTLTMAAGAHAVPALGVEIFARSVQVAGGGTASLTLAGAAATVQLTVAEIVGQLSVAVGGQPSGTALALSGVAIPQILTVAGGTLATATDEASVANVVHEPWNVLALQVTGALAGVVADRTDAGSLVLATAMLRWVTACGGALLRNRASYSGIDAGDLASMLTAAAALLTSTQAAVSGAIYVPVLSAQMYQQQVDGILGVAAVYDARIAALQNQQTVTGELAAVAATLGTINQQAAGPLIVTLQNLSAETSLLESQLMDASLQLQQVTGTLQGLEQALVDAIDAQFQKELVSAAIKTLFTVATLYVSIGFAVLDPAALAGTEAAVAKAAMGATKAVIDAAQQTVGTVIAGGAGAAGAQPSVQSVTEAQHGAQVLAGSLTSFGTALNGLWAVVGTAIAKAPAEIVYAPDFLSKLEAAPDLSGFSTGGIDPVTYWKNVVTQTQASIEPHKDLPSATAYLAAVQTAAAYGSAVGDLQMKLLDLYTQGVSTFARLQSIYQAQARWSALQSKLKEQDAQAQAAIGLLQRGDLDVKRTLVAAVDNYRAAFRYQWLQAAPVQIDVTMDYLTLKQQVERSIEGLLGVLAGTGTGSVRPRQPFADVTYRVTRGNGPLFDTVDGAAQARWSIAAGDPQLAGQLGGTTALSLTDVTFVLEGAAQPGEVELQVATSGRYANLLDGTAFRFVSRPVSMMNFYQPGPPPRFISSWRFADPAAYMTPTPYTDWTLTVLKGNWQDVTAITMTLAGSFLQNADQASS